VANKVIREVRKIPPKKRDLMKPIYDYTIVSYMKSNIKEIQTMVSLQFYCKFEPMMVTIKFFENTIDLLLVSG